jgi:hypothetical protein
VERSTICQLRLGMSITPAEVIGPIMGFSLLAGFAFWAISVVLRRIPRASSTRAEASPVDRDRANRRARPLGCLLEGHDSVST